VEDGADPAAVLDDEVDRRLLHAFAAQCGDLGQPLAGQRTKGGVGEADRLHRAPVARSAFHLRHHPGAKPGLAEPVEHRPGPAFANPDR
jgi:hypothetical protein